MRVFRLGRDYGYPRDIKIRPPEEVVLASDGVAIAFHHDFSDVAYTSLNELEEAYTIELEVGPRLVAYDSNGSWFSVVTRDIDTAFAMAARRREAQRQRQAPCNVSLFKVDRHGYLRTDNDEMVFSAALPVRLPS